MHWCTHTSTVFFPQCFFKSTKWGNKYQDRQKSWPKWNKMNALFTFNGICNLHVRLLGLWTLSIISFLKKMFWEQNIFKKRQWTKSSTPQCNVPLTEPFRTEANLHHLSYITHARTHHVPLCNSLTSSFL